MYSVYITHNGIAYGLELFDDIDRALELFVTYICEYEGNTVVFFNTKTQRHGKYLLNRGYVIGTQKRMLDYYLKMKGLL